MIPSVSKSLSLTVEEVRQRAARAPLVPVFRELLADQLTPVTAYRTLAGDGPGFLLESVEGGERLGRYSFVGADPLDVLTVRDRDPFVALEQFLQSYRAEPVDGLPERFCGGAVGYFSYEAARYLERLPVPQPDPLGVPDAVFLIADTLVCFDHVRHRLKLVTHVRRDEGTIEAAYRAAAERIDALEARLARPAALRALAVPDSAPAPVALASPSREDFFESVRVAKEHILAGDIYQVQIARRFTAAAPPDPFDTYRVLRAVNPSPYMYFLNLPDLVIFGTSPEILVTVDGHELRYRPIAGTRRRGRDLASDRRMEEELKQSEKERAEHVMLVDLGRNDLGRIAEVGSVRVTELMGIERYSHVMHLVSNIVATLAPGRTAMDALRACFPAGTVTGAPKIRAMEIIAQLERERRGVYAGAIGYLGFSGSLDTCIGIRTMVVKDGTATLQAAAGVVADSVAAEEFLEIENKAAALLHALESSR